jgi:hypothetical protein
MRARVTQRARAEPEAVDGGRKSRRADGGVWQWLCSTLLAPVDGHSLATFRMLYGFCMFNQTLFFRHVFDNFTVSTPRRAKG